MHSNGHKRAAKSSVAANAADCRAVFPLADRFRPVAINKTYLGGMAGHDSIRTDRERRWFGDGGGGGQSEPLVPCLFSVPGAIARSAALSRD